ncbi:MAG: HU family DNA-binding protein [bacterium]
MSKIDLINAIADQANLSKKAAGDALQSFINIVTKQLKTSNKVQITGFGTFLVRKRAAREGRNPRSGAKIKIPAKKTPAFTAGKTLKDAVN